MSRWFVMDMDEGVLHVCTSYGEAKQWFLDLSCTNKVLSRYRYTDGYYGLVVGDGDEEDTNTASIVREDRMNVYGGDPNQEPIYGGKGPEEFIRTHHRRDRAAD